jgi:hypothetical protein
VIQVAESTVAVFVIPAVALSTVHVTGTPERRLPLASLTVAVNVVVAPAAPATNPVADTVKTAMN